MNVLLFIRVVGGRKNVGLLSRLLVLLNGCGSVRVLSCC